MTDRGPVVGLVTAAVLALVLTVVACGGGNGVPTGPGGSLDPGETAGSIGGDPETVALTDSEIALVEGLRSDARTGCEPLADGLPKGATDAIRCDLATDLVDHVDVYAFKSAKDAAIAYLRTLRSADIRPRSGNCESGKGGDGAWAEGDDSTDLTEKDGVSFEGTLYVRDRYGCFVADGVAHAIATCGKRLVSVVAKAKPLEPLHTWMWDFGTATDLPDPTPPGICLG